MTQRSRIMLYALSTCAWCKKTKRLLNQLGVPYEFVDVDLLDPDEERAVQRTLDRLNPEGGYPVIVIGNEVISGFDESRIREAI